MLCQTSSKDNRGVEELFDKITLDYVKEGGVGEVKEGLKVVEEKRGRGCCAR